VLADRQLGLSEILVDFIRAKLYVYWKAAVVGREKEREKKKSLKSDER
jgi:hypothetical protein